MSALNCETSQPMRRGLTRWSKRGWIGVDVGTHAIKLAQLERYGSQYRIAARWTLSDPTQALVKEPASSASTLNTQLTKLKTLKRMFTGSKCAAVLPMAMIELRNFEVPAGSSSELHRMAGEELAVDLGVEPQDLAFGCWETPGIGRPDPGMARISVTSVPKSLAMQLGESLLEAGLACKALDAMPCAVARAVELATIDLLGDSIIAIDLSYTLPVMVLVKDGRPLFTRALRGVGMQAMMQPLEAGLNISSEECEQLLMRYGIAASGAAPTLATQRTTEIIARPLQDLLHEIQRTVEYIGAQFRSCKPRQICLLGGGALVKNLPEIIGESLEMPAIPWSLGAGEAAATDALFGVAAGLSALAWEEALCS